MEKELTDLYRTNFFEIEGVSISQTEDKETVLSIYCYMKFFNEDLCMSVPIRLELISNYFPSVRPRVYLLETYGYEVNSNCSYLSEQLEIDCPSLSYWTPKMSLVYVLKDVRKLFFMEFPVIRKQFYSLEEAKLIRLRPLLALPELVCPSSLCILSETRRDILYKGYFPDKPVFMRQYTTSTTFFSVMLPTILTYCQQCHPNIAQFYGYCVYNDKPCLLYEYTDIPLMDYVQNMRLTKTPNKLKSLILQICRALRWLYSTEPRPLYHRDLKIQNVFITESHIIKLNHILIPENSILPNETTSFELPESKLFSGQNLALNPYSQDYNSSVELYSFGLLLYQLFTSVSLQDACKEYKKAKKKITFDLLCESIPPCVKCTLQKLWKQNIDDTTTNVNIYDLYDEIKSWTF